ncbi:12761_t:CDS:2 [Funneliformis caledonium]|uniref:12761_t:CDS:1 n=1 Tax=Funneliformis caledonium TaxID=1117310 RepID=A0A9N8VAR1_9GLOM|nr:12761_t:CDS:2 [Funneliformis caledonium]
MDNQHVYDVHVVHQAISQFLASHIYELILDAGKKGKDIPEIGSYICKYTNCRYIPNCRDHHVTSTPLILNQRLNLACLQCTVVQRLQVLCRQKLFSIEQTKEFFGIQRWWVEKLIKVHVRYQSPQTSCPEVTHMVIAGIPDKTRYGFTDLAHNKWLRDEFNNGSDFEVMLKYVFLFQLLRDGWGFRMFDWKMSQVKEISQPDDLPAGFEYKGYHLSIPVGKRLSSFFFFLYSNKVIEAISNLNPFIQYAIINSQKINLTSIYAFGDLTTLIELSTSLVFSVGPKDCKFCLPRAYLVNYFDKFTMEPLLPQKRRAYKIDEYLAAIKNVLNQIQLLLDLLICKEPINPSIILRLIRLLVLIGLNESTFEQDVFKIFERLHKKNEIFPVKIKNYLNEKKFVRLVDVLHKDLMETGCDSLVIIHYNNFGSSKFSNLEKHGIVKITYQSIEEFLNALRQIMSSVARNTVSENRLLNNMDWSRQIRKFWNLQIHDSPRDQEAAKKIQTWFRETQERRKRTVHDPTFEKIYNEVRNFCQEFALKRKGEIVVRKYNMLLRGSTVDKIVELTKLLSSMDKNKNYLGKLKKRDYDLEICVELEEELTYVQEEVEQLLDSLSIIENMEKHEEADIEWLENELQQAKSVIDKVLEWIEKCESLD